MADGWGGARKGSGRKQKLSVALREKAIEEAGEDARYALGLYIQVMRDEQREIDLRLECAKEVKDTVWGKPAQRTELTGKNGGPIEVDDTGLSDEDRANRVMALLDRARARRSGEAGSK